jgi:hypothetical protein
LRGDGLKNHNEDRIKEQLQREQRLAGRPLWEMDQPEDFQIQFRVDEKISPAMFRPDPLIPGGYIANSLTLKAMRPTLFVAGISVDELAVPHECACGQQWDGQFWKLCPYCGRE